MRVTKQRIPNPSSTAAKAVTDGHETAGYVIEHDGSYFAFDADAVLLGEFETQQQAMRSIPKARLK